MVPTWTGVALKICASFDIDPMVSNASNFALLFDEIEFILSPHHVRGELCATGGERK